VRGAASLALTGSPAVDSSRPEILMDKTAADMVFESELP
jgi:hypothetical protein